MGLQVIKVLLLNQNLSPKLTKEEIKMKSLLRLLLKTQHRPNSYRQPQTEKGMTLIELLIGMVMAFLIITPMLAFVVDMLNTDRREQVKANTEQDIQAAVDFIAQDLSQAIYIYNRPGVNAIRTQLPEPGNTNAIPILVFWKRQQINRAIPVNNTIKPNQCDAQANVNNCNDTYVLSLVAYYQIKDNTPSSWCQPSGATCPTRIERYTISDGIRNPYANAGDANYPYYATSDTAPKTSLDKDAAFNKEFDFSKPTEKVTTGAGFESSEVLVNYLDHTATANIPQPPDCKSALGVADPTGPGSTPIDAADLLITDDNSGSPSHSFYACVDTQKNLASITIRGNSLRRLQTDANYNPNNTAFFPTATVQVQGRGALGK
jgi:type II secretory pathway pseudopilin PulG